MSSKASDNFDDTSAYEGLAAREDTSVPVGEAEDWYSARQLERMRLPGLPKHRSNIARKAKTEAWPLERATPAGGGKPAAHYPVSILPRAARLELAERRLSASDAVRQADQMLRASAQIEEQNRADRELAEINVLASLGEKERSGVEAWQAILKSFRTFEVTAGLSSGKARERFVRLYREREIDFPQAVYDAEPDFSVRTLRRRQSRYEQDGLTGLVKRYGHRSSRTYETHWDRHPEQRELVELMIARKGNRLNLENVALEIAAHFPDAPSPSRSTLWRFVDGWRAKQPSLYDYATNEATWKGRYLSAIGQADEPVVRLAQEWEIDATRSDVMLQHEHASGSVTQRRYAVLGLLEVYSRMAKILVVPHESTRAVLFLLRRAFLEWRRFPELVRTDQGTVFTSNHFDQAMRDLRINVHLLPPGKPEGKPFVESFFSTFNGGLLKTLPGFIGRCVAERKAIEASERLTSRGGLTHEDDAVDLPLSREEMQLFCDAWTDSYYNTARQHRTIGCTPAERVQRWRERGRQVRGIPTERVDEYEAALSVLLSPAPKSGGRPEGVRTVSKAAVRVDGVKYAAPELGEEWNGREVFVRYDETDVSRIFVFSMEGLFICIGRGVGVPGGVSPQEAARKVRAAQKRFRKKSLAEIEEHAPKYDLGKAAWDLVEKHEKKIKQADGEPLETPLVTQAWSVPAFEEGLRAARALTEEEKATPVRAGNDPATEAMISRLEDEEEARKATRPKLWADDSHRYLWCRERVAAGFEGDLHDEDWAFITRFEEEAGRTPEERLTHRGGLGRA